jgi:hypothetical protein
MYLNQFRSVVSRPVPARMAWYLPGERWHA